ncbi:MAG: penicillin-binding transpeptidase domain-containing protein [Patescibacteria group bacterium]
MTDNSSLKKRASILGFVIIGLFSLLMVRLIDVQLIKGENFRQLADDNRFFSKTVNAERGIVLDRYDQPLVRNTRRYFQMGKEEALFAQKQFISQQRARELLAEGEEEIGYETMRQYLYPWSLAHVLGYVGPVSKEDLLSDRSLLISDQRGKIALEKIYDKLLRGQPGREVYEIDARGRRQFFYQTRPARAGQDLSTTIDPYLSEVAQQALGQQSGAVLIADASNSELLALVSSPTYNANVFSVLTVEENDSQQRQQQIRQFLNDQQQVFFNRAVSGSYPPGSIFKIITALAGLEEGKIDPQTSVLDEGVLKVNDYEYANWYYTQYGRTEGQISLRRAIARSNDIYFYKVAEWVGPDKLAQMARLYGLGSVTGIEIGAEAEGNVPDPTWKERVIGEKWYLGNTYHFGIGQGDVLVTPVQMLQLVQGVANRGRVCSPSLLKNDQHNCKETGVKEENLQIVLQGMLAACSSGGTAYPFFSHNQAIGLEGSDDFSGLEPSSLIEDGAIACKTGTAEFGGANEKGYRQTHAWFTAVVGLDTKSLIEKYQSVIAEEQRENAIKLDKSAGDSILGDDESETAERANLSDNLVDQGASLLEATSSADVSKLNNDFQHQSWLRKIAEHGFPKELVIVVLVESDKDNPYKEGSKDAAPVAKSIIDWMKDGKFNKSTSNS